MAVTSSCGPVAEHHPPVGQHLLDEVGVVPDQLPRLVLVDDPSSNGPPGVAYVDPSGVVGGECGQSRSSAAAQPREPHGWFRRISRMSDRLYFRQLLAGRDFAVGDPVATQMVNFAYLIGDRETGEALIVDPAYAVGDLVDTLTADGMRLTGVLATHHHPDHVGGEMMGFSLPGLAELLAIQQVPVHVNRAERDWVQRTAQVSGTDLVSHDHDDVLDVGAISIRLLHTPGHTPGSQCFLLDGRLVAGDTLFLQGCGRTDFPGGDADAIYRSLQALAALPGDPVVFPGHQYSPEPHAPLSEVRSTNIVLRTSSLEQFRGLFA
jgi:glyoxylase-like metal-dependent hydrolase (beta-lactamase superfamily II)